MVTAILLTTTISSFAQSEWKVPITVTCNNWEKVLYFGSHPNASDAYDTGLDTLSPPPGFGPFAYFYVSAFPNFLVSDIRKSVESTTWLLKTANCSGNKVKLKWDLTAFHSIEGQNGNLVISSYVSMLEKDSLVLTGDISLEILFTISTTEIAEKVSDSRSESYVSAVYPNPFNSLVNINFNTPKSGQAKITVHDMLGREVIKLYQGFLSAKMHNLTWHALDEGRKAVPSGIYFIRININHQYFIQKVQLLR